MEEDKKVVGASKATEFVDGLTWETLQTVLRDADETSCQLYLTAEAEGKKRHQWLRRIHQRFNKLRADRERRELAIL